MVISSLLLILFHFLVMLILGLIISWHGLLIMILHSLPMSWHGLLIMILHSVPISRLILSRGSRAGIGRWRRWRRWVRALRSGAWRRRWTILQCLHSLICAHSAISESTNTP